MNLTIIKPKRYDVIVYTPPIKLTSGQIQRLGDQLHREFPLNRVLIIDGDRVARFG